jgi:hypothetical protein
MSDHANSEEEQAQQTPRKNELSPAQWAQKKAAGAQGGYAVSALHTPQELSIFQQAAGAREGV